MQEKTVAGTFLFVASLFYLALALAALIWGYLGRFGEVFTLHLQRPHIGQEILLFAGTFSFNALFVIYAPKFIKPVEKLMSALSDTLGAIGYREAFLLALVSALGEEMLFRGAVQSSFGFVAATLMFAISHFPVRRELLVWPFYALCIGAALSVLRILGGDIWSAVLLHFSINLFGLIFISRRETGQKTLS